MCGFDRGRFIIVYADDILLLSPSVVDFKKLVHLCEREMIWLNMAINCFKKSCCLRIGSHCDIKCANTLTPCGHAIPFYVVVFFLIHTISCSLSDDIRTTIYSVQWTVIQCQQQENIRNWRDTEPVICHWKSQVITLSYTVDICQVDDALYFYSFVWSVWNVFNFNFDGCCFTF